MANLPTDPADESKVIVDNLLTDPPPIEDLPAWSAWVHNEPPSRALVLQLGVICGYRNLKQTSPNATYVTADLVMRLPAPMNQGTTVPDFVPEHGSPAVASYNLGMLLESLR